MNVVGKNVHRYREGQGLSLGQLAEKAKWDKMNLYRLEQAGTGYSHASITRLAKALGVSLSALFDENINYSYGAPVGLPVYKAEEFTIDENGAGSIQRPPYKAGQIEYLVYTDGSFSENAFAFFVQDHAMRPDLEPDDIVILDPDLVPEPNDIVLAAIYRKSTGKTHLVLRRFAEREATDSSPPFELLPSDNAYSAERPHGNNIHIFGTVVEHRRPRRR